MDWKFWIPLIVNIVGLGLAYKQLRLMQPETQQSEMARSNLKRYWPVIVCLFLMLGAWVPYYAFDSRKSNIVRIVTQPYEGRILTQWGTGEDETCEVVVNGRLLMKFKDTFGVAVACGFKNSAIDKLEDTNISVSSAFTIRPEPIEISIPLSQQMATTFKDRVGRANKQAIDSRKGTAHLKTSIWFEAFFYLNQLIHFDIHKLADVPRHGGQIPGPGIK